jgi:hypothetical protein
MAKNRITTNSRAHARSNTKGHWLKLVYLFSIDALILSLCVFDLGTNSIFSCNILLRKTIKQNIDNNTEQNEKNIIHNVIY